MKQLLDYRHSPPDCHVAARNPAQLSRPAAFTIALLGALLLLAPGTPLQADSAVSTQPDSSSQNAIDKNIAGLIGNLTSDDGSVRQSASASLIEIGAPARPAILKAVRSEDPGLRELATQILIALPWDLPTDPEKVRALLKNYSVPDVDARSDIASELAYMSDVPTAVLDRLLREDPSPEIRWIMVRRFHSASQGPQLGRFRDIQPADGDAPLLALCGFANLGVHPEKARKYLQRCADQEFAAPTRDDGQFDYVIHALVDFARVDHKYEVAANLRRKELEHDGPTDPADGPPNALAELFALQADYGPLAGLDDDLKLAGPAMNSAKIQYALSRLYAHQGRKEQSEAARFAAWTASTNRHERAEVADYLYQHGWDDLATAEFNELLKLPMGEDSSDEIDTHFKLAAMAIKHGDDLTAARQKELAIRSMGGNTKNIVAMDRYGQVWPMPVEQLWAEIHWRYLHDAIARKDAAQTQEHLNELIKLKPDDAEIAMDVVPLLRERGQPADATAVFNEAFEASKAKLDADPKNPELLNGLAWMCAKCDERLDEALAWATQASNAMPDNSAILDTLAEVNFRLGRAQEAARLEARALELTPGDEFIASQLQRFQSPATSKSSEGK